MKHRAAWATVATLTGLHGEQLPREGSPLCAAPVCDAAICSHLFVKVRLTRLDSHCEARGRFSSLILNVILVLLGSLPGVLCVHSPSEGQHDKLVMKMDEVCSGPHRLRFLQNYSRRVLKEHSFHSPTPSSLPHLNFMCVLTAIRGTKLCSSVTTSA